MTNKDKILRPVMLVNKLDISPKQTHFWVPCAEKIIPMVLIDITLQ